MTTLVTGLAALALLAVVLLLFLRIRYLKGLIAEQEKCMSRMRMIVVDLAHDMKTPLTLISGPIRDLLDGAHGELTSRTLRAFERAERNANRLESLMGKLVSDAGRYADAKRCNAVVDCVNVTQTVREVVDQHHELAEQAGITIAFMAADPDLAVGAESQAVERVVTNLLANAIKFTPSGGRVRVDVYAGGCGERVVLEIEDSGCGIDPTDRKRLFRRYFRAGRAKRSVAGWGLGLNIVRRLVQDMNGFVEVESQPGEGTRIRVVLPQMSVRPSTPDAVRRPGLSRAVDGGRWIPEMSVEGLAEVRSTVVSDS